MFAGRTSGRYYTHLTLEELEEIKAISGFTENEVLQLENKFEALAPENGRIGIEAFLRLPELSMPLSKKIPEALGLKGPSLDLKGFCKVLALFHPRAALEDKIHFIFKLYDADNDGMISRQDLKSTLELIGGEASDEQLIAYSVGKVFTELGVEDIEGKLAKDDFTHGIGGIDVQKFISFSFDED